MIELDERVGVGYRIRILIIGFYLLLLLLRGLLQFLGLGLKLIWVLLHCRDGDSSIVMLLCDYELSCRNSVLLFINTHPTFTRVDIPLLITLLPAGTTLAALPLPPNHFPAPPK